MALLCEKRRDCSFSRVASQAEKQKPQIPLLCLIMLSSLPRLVTWVLSQVMRCSSFALRTGGRAGGKDVGDVKVHLTEQRNGIREIKTEGRSEVNGTRASVTARDKEPQRALRGIQCPC